MLYEKMTKNIDRFIVSKNLKNCLYYNIKLIFK